MASLKLLADKRVKQPKDDTAQKLLSIGEDTLTQDYEVLSQLRFKNTEVNDVFDEREKTILFNKTRRLYGNSFYNKQQLKELAIIYNLRLLRTSLYKGKVPQNIVGNINQFCKLHDIDIKSHSSEDFYILGPENHFMITTKKSNDIILLYKTEDNYFIPVVTWGKELSFIRYLKSWRKRTPSHRFWGNFILYTILFYVILILFIGINIVSLIIPPSVGFVGSILDVVTAEGNWLSTTNIWDSTKTRTK